MSRSPTERLGAVVPNEDPDDSVPVSLRVVEAVAAERGVDETEIEPLHHFIDSDSLNELFAGAGEKDNRSPRYVSFIYAGCRVEISYDGSVDVTSIGGGEIEGVPEE